MVDRRDLVDLRRIVSLEAWWRRARCAGEDSALFYPPQGGSSRPGKKICASCPVRVDCLLYSLVAGEIYGIWGGTTEEERRLIRRLITREAECRSLR
jgi:WhiB family redox-sensing transcriptional regulator